MEPSGHDAEPRHAETLSAMVKSHHRAVHTFISTGSDSFLSGESTKGSPPLLLLYTLYKASVIGNWCTLSAIARLYLSIGTVRLESFQHVGVVTALQDAFRPDI